MSEELTKVESILSNVPQSPHVPAHIKITVRSTLLGVVVEIGEGGPTAYDPLNQRKNEHLFSNLSDAFQALPEICARFVSAVSVQ